MRQFIKLRHCYREVCAKSTEYPLYKHSRYLEFKIDKILQFKNNHILSPQEHYI
jgi:hypothetical protein